MLLFNLFIGLVLSAPAAQVTPTASLQTLKDGISANLKVQQRELDEIGKLQRTVKKLESTKDQQDYSDYKKNLVSAITHGIQIRAKNQQIAASLNSASVPGLKKVEGAQKVELAQAVKLGLGAADQWATNDAAVIDTLSKEVTAGIAQNKENLSKA